MATKKQKREAGIAKRAKFDADLKAQGLAALEMDREERRLKHLRDVERGMEMQEAVERTARSFIAIAVGRMSMS